jgi:hypothetical protein
MCYVDNVGATAKRCLYNIDHRMFEPLISLIGPVVTTYIHRFTADTRKPSLR